MTRRYTNLCSVNNIHGCFTITMFDIAKTLSHDFESAILFFFSPHFDTYNLLDVLFDSTSSSC